MRVPVLEASPTAPAKRVQWRVPIAAVLLTLLTLAVAAGATRGIDRAAVRAAQAYPAGWLDWLSWAVSFGGHIVISGPLVLLLGAWLWRRSRRGALALLVVFVVATLLEIAGKQWIGHPGPGTEFYRELPAGLPFVYTGTGEVIELANSYPSGHALRITFIAVVLIALLPHRLTVLAAAAVIGVMAFTRVYGGEHWLSDVAGGVILGAGAAWLIEGWLVERDPALSRG